MTAVNCDKFGPFNGIFALEQSNWSNFWHWVVPEGVIANCDDELKVYAQTDGMKVYVKTGQAFLAGHRVWSSSVKTIPIEAADGSNPRIDLIVCRIIFGNDEESLAVLDVKTGTPAADPQAPALLRTVGGTYEIPLAEVYVGAGVVTIQDAKVTDRRRIFAAEANVVTFTQSPVTPLAMRDYRCFTTLSALTVNLPDAPQNNFITSIRFPSGSSFSGVTVKKGATTISGTTNLKVKGDVLTLVSRTYTLVFWWDGAVYWVASAAE